MCFGLMGKCIKLWYNKIYVNFMRIASVHSGCPLVRSRWWGEAQEKEPKKIENGTIRISLGTRWVRLFRNFYASKICFSIGLDSIPFK